ncbi:hypothetical protein V2J09_008954, partial [Rumex salicifolius]
LSKSKTTNHIEELFFIFNEVYQVLKLIGDCSLFGVDYGSTLGFVISCGGRNISRRVRAKSRVQAEYQMTSPPSAPFELQQVLYSKCTRPGYERRSGHTGLRMHAYMNQPFRSVRGQWHDPTRPDPQQSITSSIVPSNSPPLRPNPRGSTMSPSRRRQSRTSTSLLLLFTPAGFTRFKPLITVSHLQISEFLGLGGIFAIHPFLFKKLTVIG